MRIGYSREWFLPDDEGVGFEGVLRSIENTLHDRGAELVEIALPDLPYDLLYDQIKIDAAAAFESVRVS